MNDLLEAARSILKVGDGRGFVVNGERDRLPSGGCASETAFAPTRVLLGSNSNRPHPPKISVFLDADGTQEFS
jgi:hypothetical protein